MLSEISQFILIIILPLNHYCIMILDYKFFESTNFPTISKIAYLIITGKSPIFSVMMFLIKLSFYEIIKTYSTNFIEDITTILIPPGRWRYHFVRKAYQIKITKNVN
jgi:hypothetical protein